jgi:hypothetical protein
VTKNLFLSREQCIPFRDPFRTIVTRPYVQAVDGPPVSHDSNPDIPLTSVAVLWAASSSGRRRLSRGMRHLGPVEQLEVLCKDFYHVSFSFKLSDKKETAQVCAGM